MEDSSVSMSDGRKIGYRLQDSRFIVRMHYRHQHGVCRHAPREEVRIDQAGTVDGEICHLKTQVSFHVVAGREDSGMLSILRDDVITTLPKGHGHALDCEIVALAAACGEDNLIRRAANKVCYALPRGIHRFLSSQAVD